MDLAFRQRFDVLRKTPLYSLFYEQLPDINIKPYSDYVKQANNAMRALRITHRSQNIRISPFRFKLVVLLGAMSCCDPSVSNLDIVETLSLTRCIEWMNVWTSPPINADTDDLVPALHHLHPEVQSGSIEHGHLFTMLQRYHVL